MDRRKFLTVASTLTVTGVAGCSGSSDEQDGEETSDASSSDDGSTDTESSSETESDSSSSDSDSSDSSYQVRISYDGEWSGSISGDGSSRTVDGSGTETFDIDGDPFIVSANGQKRDDGSGTLTVEILQGGEVIARQSTSASYGVAQVTSEDGISDSSDSDSQSESESEPTYQVEISYSGEWQGSIASGGSSRSVQGSGSDTIEIDGSPDIISANAQKQDDSSDELTIRILQDGEVVKDSSTSAEYGVAQVSISNF
jgi:hypothetical protein